MVRTKKYFLKKIFFSLWLLGMVCEASSKPNYEVGDLKKQVHHQSKKISEIRKEIGQFEQNLNLSHKNYLEVIEEKQKLESRMREVQEAQEILKKRLLHVQQEAKKTLAYQVLQQLNEDAEPGQILAQKILIQALSEQLRTIETEIESHNQASKILTSLENSYIQKEKTEIELLTVIQELEVKKKIVAENYLEQQKKLDELKSRYGHVTAKISKSQARSQELVTALKFSAPLSEYSSLDHGKKGVSFTFRGRHPVLSTHDGEIVYSGELSTFGNVVMIDHGDETRSVILGDFIPKAEQGTRVKVGDVVGYTSERLQQGQIYFEVRKNNTVANTIQLMDSNSLDKNALAKR